VIRETIIAPRGLTVKAAAEAVGVARPTLNNLVNGKADLSGDMAIRFEKAFGASMEDLLLLQHVYHVARARERYNDISVPRWRDR
jgi:addiction module HigA family antidote